MELSQLSIFLKVVSEKGFSRAAYKLTRSQPAISMAVQRLEMELGAKLLDRTLKDGTLTDEGKIVYHYAQKIETLCQEMVNALAELRDKHTGKLTIGANENGTLYLLHYTHVYRQRYPRVKVEVRRSLSRHIPTDVLENALDLGVVSYKPSDPNLGSHAIYTDAMVLIVYPEHRLAKTKEISIHDLGVESFISHNISSPIRQLVLDTFQKFGVPVNIDLEMPTIETMKKMIRMKMGVSFLPRICVQEELASGDLVEVAVREFKVAREIFLIYPLKRGLSHAAGAFVELVEKTAPTMRERVTK